MLADNKYARRSRELLIESIKSKHKENIQGLYPGLEVSLNDRPGLYRKRLVRRCRYLAERVAGSEQPENKVKWDEHELEALCWAMACIDELIGRGADGSVE